jgi:hypothetical protein
MFWCFIKTGKTERHSKSQRRNMLALKNTAKTLIYVSLVRRIFAQECASGVLDDSFASNHHYLF